MEVYIEDVILDNLIINFLILYLVKKITKNDKKLIFLLFSVIFGVIFVFFSLFFQLTGILNFIYKIILSVAMVIIAFGFGSFKRFLVCYFSFVFTTFLFGGLCMALSITLGSFAIIDGQIYYDLSLPMWLIILLISLTVYVIFHLINKLKLTHLQNDFYYKISLDWQEKTHIFRAYLDTGNSLECDGYPVIALSFARFKKIFNVPLTDILLHKTNLKNAHYINANSVTGNSKILVFDVENIKIIQKNYEKTLKNVKFGLIFNNLEKKLNCSALLGINIFNGD